MVSYIKGGIQTKGIWKHKVLRQIFGPKRVANGEWRRLHNEELDCLYRSPNIDRVIKSRRLRWAGHEWRKVEVLSKFYQVNLQERYLKGGLGVDGRTILEWTYRGRYQCGELG